MDKNLNTRQMDNFWLILCQKRDMFCICEGRLTTSKWQTLKYPLQTSRRRGAGCKIEIFGVLACRDGHPVQLITIAMMEGCTTVGGHPCPSRREFFTLHRYPMSLTCVIHCCPSMSMTNLSQFGLWYDLLWFETICE